MSKLIIGETYLMLTDDRASIWILKSINNKFFQLENSSICVTFMVRKHLNAYKVFKKEFELLATNRIEK